MSNLDFTIRNERPDDYEALLDLTYKAFLTLDYPGRGHVDEHFLIHLLKNSDAVIKELCFVAVLDGEMIGHILYTKSKFRRPDGSEADTVTFGPLSVLPEYHRRGVGATLVRHTLTEARNMGFKAVLIVGVVDYYPKLGFKRASEYGLIMADGSATDAFMVYELENGYLTGGGVYHGWAPEFDIAENDTETVKAFHRQFMTKRYPGELILRPLFDDDVALMEAWLKAEHIAPWYEHPEDWLYEIKERYGEFSFITHLIAEIDGKAIGFCQYYDCFDAKEDWYNVDTAGEVYSIDYLIGEPEVLRRGFSKMMIAKLLEILRKKNVSEVIVQPDEQNQPSVRALLANVFEYDGERYRLKL